MMIGLLIIVVIWVGLLLVIDGDCSGVFSW